MGHFTGDRQNHIINHRVAKHRVAHFTGDGQIKGSRILQDAPRCGVIAQTHRMRSILISKDGASQEAREIGQTTGCGVITQDGPLHRCAFYYFLTCSTLSGVKIEDNTDKDKEIRSYIAEQPPNSSPESR